MESGKFVLRLDSSQHRALKNEALRRALSLNQLCIEKLSARTTDSTAPWVDAILKVFGRKTILGILLYGSAARGEASSVSDLDLMIVFDSSYLPERKTYALWDEQIQPHLPPTANPSFVAFSKEACSGLWLELALDGLMLWQRDSTLQNHLARLRSRIAAGEFRRQFIHGQPHWIRSSEEVK